MLSGFNLITEILLVKYSYLWFILPYNGKLLRERDEGLLCTKKPSIFNGNCVHHLLAKRTSVTIVNDLLCLQFLLETWNTDNKDTQELLLYNLGFIIYYHLSCISKNFFSIFLPVGIKGSKPPKSISAYILYHQYFKPYRYPVEGTVCSYINSLWCSGGESWLQDSAAASSQDMLWQGSEYPTAWPHSQTARLQPTLELLCSSPLG